MIVPPRRQERLVFEFGLFTPRGPEGDPMVEEMRMGNEQTLDSVFIHLRERFFSPENHVDGIVKITVDINLYP